MPDEKKPATKEVEKEEQVAPPEPGLQEEEVEKQDVVTEAPNPESQSPNFAISQPTVVSGPKAEE